LIDLVVDLLIGCVVDLLIDLLYRLVDSLIIVCRLLGLFLAIECGGSIADAVWGILVIRDGVNVDR
jgi:hypothetical protein